MDVGRDGRMYRAVFEFRLTRRVDWGSDLAAFHAHVDDVRNRIAATELIDDVRVITDIAAARLTLDFLVDAADAKAAEAGAMYTVSRAIKDSGARHLGMATPAADPNSSGSALSDLHTPIWQRQRLHIASAA